MRLITKLIQRLRSRQVSLTKESPWVTVFESSDEFVIRINKLRLEDEEIPVIIFDQRDSSYNNFGLIYLKVQHQDQERALEILNSSNE
jgi:hypothetical protein